MWFVIAQTNERRKNMATASDSKNNEYSRDLSAKV